MIGNDFASNKSREINTKKPVEPERSFVFHYTNEERQYAYQNSGTLAFNTSADSHAGRAFVFPTISGLGLGIFTRTRMIYLAMVLMLIGIAAGAIIYKQQIVILTRAGATFIAQQISHESPSHNAAAPAANPQQLTIYTSNYDNAITDIMTQSVTLNVGSSSWAISGSNIASWVNSKKQGSYTILSINSSQLTIFLNQLVKNAAQKGQTVTNFNAAYNQIANNLLKAKGITVTIPT